METINMIIIVLALNYLLFQLERSLMVCIIRHGWITKDDPKFYKYTYAEMFEPSLRNWFGLKFPRESDF